MPDTCCKFGYCNRRSKFYGIPSQKEKPELRKKWITAIRWEKFTERKINNTPICSAHFTTGNYNNTFSKVNYMFF